MQAVSRSRGERRRRARKAPVAVLASRTVPEAARTVKEEARAGARRAGRSAEAIAFSAAEERLKIRISAAPFIIKRVRNRIAKPSSVFPRSFGISAGVNCVMVPDVFSAGNMVQPQGPCGAWIVSADCISTMELNDFIGRPIVRVVMSVKHDFFSFQNDSGALAPGPVNDIHGFRLLR